MKRIATLILIAACGGGGGDDSQAQSDAATPDGEGSGSADASIDSPPGNQFTLTSPVLTEGAAIMAVNTCDDANTSPQLDWSGDNMNAMSFAVVLTDKSNNLVHWVIYDIPGTATGLPEDVQQNYVPNNVTGAHQTTSYTPTVRGYQGPCPPQGGGAHNYEFAVYGIDAAALPGATMATTRQQAIAIIMQHMTATATLTGNYMR